MSLTPEQEAAALELARTWPAGFASANDTNDLARAVLHFAEERDAALLDCEDCKISCLKALANRDAQWAAICAERDALKADYAEEVAEFNAGFEAAKRGEPESAEPDQTKYDVWMCGYAWFKYPALKADAEVVKKDGERRARELRIAEAVIEAAAEIADDHSCGGTDDIVCQHLNCGTIIAGAIRAASRPAIIASIDAAGEPGKESEGT